MNDALRQHQGRPRGAARPRPDLPDRARAADAPQRRLAADDVPDAARRAVFRRHLFPEGRRATACPGFLDLLPRVAARVPRAGRRRSPSRTRGSQRRDARASSRTTRDVVAAQRRRRRARRAASARSIPTDGGFGSAPKFPHPFELELLRCARTRRSGDAERAARSRRTTLDAHGRRRHPRPARRRLLPLQRRRASGRSRISRRCSTTTGRCSALYAETARATGEPRYARRRARHRRRG